MTWLTVVGGGLAGLSLCDEILTIFEQSNKPLPGKIQVYEQKTSFTDDRSYCFFANTAPSLDKFQRYSSWKFSVDNDRKSVTHSSSTLNYYRLRGIDVFEQLLSRLNAHQQVSVNMGVQVENKPQQGLLVDTRPAPLEQFLVKQSFVGKEIKLQRKQRQSQATLMGNMRLEDGRFTFDYILPTGENTALLEVTQFSNTVASREALETLWQQSAERYDLGNDVIREECAVLPMGLTNSNKHRLNSQQIRWGTGYGYLETKRWARSCAQSIIFDDQPLYPSKITLQNRFDNALLKVIANEPDKLPEIFLRLAEKMGASKFASFLTEPKLKDYLSVMYAVPKPPFLRSLYGRH